MKFKYLLFILVWVKLLKLLKPSDQHDSCTGFLYLLAGNFWGVSGMVKEKKRILLINNICTPVKLKVDLWDLLTLYA